jgi:hypothetical protein
VLDATIPHVSTPQVRQPIDRGHHALFFDTHDFLADRVAGFIGEGLAAGEHVIVLATLPHWNAVTYRLDQAGVDYGRAVGDGQLVLIDADHVLDTIVVDGSANTERFCAMLNPLIKRGARVRVYGELVSLLVQRGDLDGALAIERVGHETTAGNPNLLILCGYHAAGGRPMTAHEIGRVEQAHDRSTFETAAVPAPPQPFHAVRFYENRESLADLVGQFVGDGLREQLPAVVIATPEHRAAIIAALGARGLDAARLEASGDLILADADATLAQFMDVDGMPNPVRFRSAVVPLLEQASRGRRGCVVRAYGEMVDVLWRQGHTEAAVRLETLWNELAQSHAFALLCGYSMGHFFKGAAPQAICGQHTHVIAGAPGRLQ